MVTNPALRFNRQLRLPSRQRSQKTNLFIQNNSEQLRRELRIDRRRWTLSNQDGRYVNPDYS